MILFVHQVEVLDPGQMASRRHLNVRGKSANLPAITDKDWLDLQFGIDVGVDYYALSFVRVSMCIIVYSILSNHLEFNSVKTCF